MNVDFDQNMLGIKSTNALKGLIYKKQLRMSNATNKKYSTGEVINFVQSDAPMLYWLSGFLPQIATIPFILGFCICALFYLLGWTFFAGIFILLLSMVVNYFISKRDRAITKVLKKAQDARVALTTEALTNIKILKIYGWTDIFKGLIQEKRNDELTQQAKDFKLTMFLITFIFLFP
jgi:ABC-type transport system involved in cytochrome bd biosynthesis fused ATPase/permease subunit